MKLIEDNQLTAFEFEAAPKRPYKVRYHAGFLPTGVAIAIVIGDAETIVNPSDPAVSRMLDKLSRQRDVTLFAEGGAITMKQGRMAQRQLQAILGRTSSHLRHCRLNWSVTLNEFTRPNLAAS